MKNMFTTLNDRFMRDSVLTQLKPSGGQNYYCFSSFRRKQNEFSIELKIKMPLPPALAAKLAKRGILQQSDTNTGSKSTQKSAEGTFFYWILVTGITYFYMIFWTLFFTAREQELKLAEETAAQKEKEEQLLELKLKVFIIS